MPTSVWKLGGVWKRDALLQNKLESAVMTPTEKLKGVDQITGNNVQKFWRN